MASETRTTTKGEGAVVVMSKGKCSTNAMYRTGERKIEYVLRALGVMMLVK